MTTRSEIIESGDEKVTVTPYGYTVEILIDQPRETPYVSGGRAKISLGPDQAARLARMIITARAVVTAGQLMRVLKDLPDETAQELHKSLGEHLRDGAFE